MEARLDRVGTCCEYLAGILAPVRTTGTKHVFSDQVSIIVLVSTHIVGEEVHLSFPEVLRLIPQTGREDKLLKPDKYLNHDVKYI